MTNAVLEKPRPPQKEVTKPIAQTGVRIPETEEAAAVSEVERFLAEQNPDGPVARAKPVTAETPIPPSPELESIKAERVGGIEPPLAGLTGADVLHAGKIWGSKVTGKPSWLRLAFGKGFINALRERIRGKASVKQITPIEEGE